MSFCLIPVQKWFNFSLVNTDLILYLSSTGCWIKDPYSEHIHMWYALQTCLSLEQEHHYWQEKSMGFQGAIFRRNVCLKLIICLMSFFVHLPVSWVWKHSPECRSLCGPFDVCCWPVSLTSCNGGVPAPALLADLFCRWGRAKGRHQTLQMQLVYPSTGSVGQLCRQWGCDPAGGTHSSTARLGEGWR